MAKAEMKTTGYTLNLTLNQAEAETLRAILSKIGGVAITSRRRFADAMRNALDSAGVAIVNVKTPGWCTKIGTHDCIYFDDEVVNG
jgi:hypothetical protein